MNKFLKLNKEKYSDMEWSGEHESEINWSHKQEWGAEGVKMLEKMGQQLEKYLRN